MGMTVKNVISSKEGLQYYISITFFYFVCFVYFVVWINNVCTLNNEGITTDFFMKTKFKIRINPIFKYEI